MSIPADTTGATSLHPLTLSLSKGERALGAAALRLYRPLAMAFWVYILECADGSDYVGHSDNLEDRLLQHQSGALGGYTKTRRPVRLAYAQEFATRDEAFAAERQIKGWSRQKKAALIRSDWPELQRLARGRQRSWAHPSTSSG